MRIKIELNTHRGKLCNNLPILFPIEIFYFNLPLTLFTTYNVDDGFHATLPRNFSIVHPFVLFFLLLCSFKQHDLEVNKQYMTITMKRVGGTLFENSRKFDYF